MFKNKKIVALSALMLLGSSFSAYSSEKKTTTEDTTENNNKIKTITTTTKTTKTVDEKSSVLKNAMAGTILGVAGAIVADIILKICNGSEKKWSTIPMLARLSSTLAITTLYNKIYGSKFTWTQLQAANTALILMPNTIFSARSISNSWFGKTCKNAANWCWERLSSNPNYNKKDGNIDTKSFIKNAPLHKKDIFIKKTLERSLGSVEQKNTKKILTTPISNFVKQTAVQPKPPVVKNIVPAIVETITQTNPVAQSENKSIGSSLSSWFKRATNYFKPRPN